MSCLGYVASNITRRLLSRTITSSTFLETNLIKKLSAENAGKVCLITRSFSTEIVPGVGKGKTSTGLTGIPVDLDAVQKIIDKNQALLDKMDASDMPADARYRINVEAVARYRIAVCRDNYDDPETIEELCDCGQVEELAIQGDDEMIVLDMYLESRMWERVVKTEVEYHYEEPEEEEKEADPEETK